MHTLVILCGLRKSKQHRRPKWRDTLHRVIQEYGGSSMAAAMVFGSVGRHKESQWHFRTIVWWVLATWYLGRFSECPIAGRDIAANACERTRGISQTRPRCHIKRGASSETREKRKFAPHYTPFTLGNAILFSAWPSSSFEPVANWVFCGSCGYIPHVCRTGKRWTHRDAAQFPGLKKSLCVCNYTQSGSDRPNSYSSKPCSKTSEVLGCEWAASGMCMSCPARAIHGSPKLVTCYGSWWLW